MLDRQNLSNLKFSNFFLIGKNYIIQSENFKPMDARDSLQ